MIDEDKKEEEEENKNKRHDLSKLEKDCDWICSVDGGTC